MFFYDSLSWQQVLMWFAVVGGLILLNEVARISKWFSIAIFIIVPVICTIFVWPKTGGETMNDWFHWAKVWSSLAGCIGFMAIRYIKGAVDKKWALCFPPLILVINIFEACIRDFQIYGVGYFTQPQILDGMRMLSGPWNIMNGIAGILNAITVCGWLGIYISKDKHQDMVWPDMLWFWILAYDFWNFAYTYNCLGDRSFYNGLGQLTACTLAAFLIKKGAWLQHRAQTLAIWCMFSFTWPAMANVGTFAVKSTYDPKALMVASIIALVSNGALFIYQIYTIISKKRNPLKDELYTHLKSYQKVAEQK